MERIPEQNHLMTETQQCQSYNDSFKNDYELKDYIKLYKDIIGINKGKIVDLGSGSCNFVIALCLEFPELYIDCYEDSTTMIEIAEQNIQKKSLGHRIKIIKDDLLNATGTYDAVLLNRVLHHIDDTTKLWETTSKLSDKLLAVDFERFDADFELETFKNEIKSMLDPVTLEDAINSLRASYTLKEVEDQIKYYNYKVESILINPQPNLKFNKLLIYHNK